MHDSPYLIVKTHAFGDAMMCTPAVRSLIRERKNPFWVLTGPSAADIWRRMPGIQRVFVAPVPPANSMDSLKLPFWSIRNRSALRDVQMAYVFQGAVSVRKWVRQLCRSSVRSAGSKPLGSWETVFPLPGDEYAGISYSRIADSEPSDWKPEFPVLEDEKRWVDELDLPDPLFAVAPGGGRNPRDDVPEKRWNPERFTEIGDRLSGEGYQTVIIGGKEDIQAAGEMQENMRTLPVNMAGRTTWGQTAAIMDRCRGFIGADSGTAHLAAARSLPSVVLFGPTSPGLLYAPGLINPVLPSVVCSPCYSNRVFPGCSRNTAQCMDSISVDDAWHAVQKVINENNRH